MSDQVYAAPKLRFVKERPEKSSKPKKEIPRKNRKRAARVFAEDFHSKEFVAWIQSLPCGLCGIEGLSQAAHIKSRGAGGKAANNIVPLCGNIASVGHVGCHFVFDLHTPEARAHTLRLKTLAKRLYAQFLDTQSAGSRRAE